MRRSPAVHDILAPSPEAHDRLFEAPLIGLKKKITRPEQLAARLQSAYRCRLARRILRRLHKLRVFRLETSAVITLQCFARVVLARKAATRKRALTYYKRFMLTTRPNLRMALGWSQKETEDLAAVTMQVLNLLALLIQNYKH